MKINKTEIKSYFNIQHQIACASHWVSLTTGEQIKLNAECKILWCYMVDRYQFFTGRRESWFDNQDALAAAVGVSRSTVVRFVKELEKHGYLQITKLPLRGFINSNSYTIKADLVVINKNEETGPKPIANEESIVSSDNFHQVDLNIYVQDGEAITGHLSEVVPDDIYAKTGFDFDGDNECSESMTTAVAPAPEKTDNHASNSHPMPKNKYSKSGYLSTEMCVWLGVHGYSIISQRDCAAYKDGKTYLLKAGELVEDMYSSTQDEEPVF